MIHRSYLLHALTPLHAGTGQAAELIDLPTARMKATGIPFVPGSSIKGVLRDDCRGKDAGQLQAVFGPDTENASAHAGALVVGDARLLALPVKSFRGTFAWVSSPLLLFLAGRDIGLKQWPIPEPKQRGALVPPDSLCAHNEHVYLEDLDLPAARSEQVAILSRILAPSASPGHDVFSRRLVIVDDDTMAFLCETSTQIDTRVRLDPATRTTAHGALWLEESLPPESLLLGLLAADRSRRRGVTMTPDEVLEFALAEPRVVQIGGKATVGRGRCRLVPFSGNGTGTGNEEAP